MNNPIGAICSCTMRPENPDIPRFAFLGVLENKSAYILECIFQEWNVDGDRGGKFENQGFGTCFIKKSNESRGSFELRTRLLALLPNTLSCFLPLANWKRVIKGGARFYITTVTKTPNYILNISLYSVGVWQRLLSLSEKYTVAKKIHKSISLVRTANSNGCQLTFLVGHASVNIVIA